jgi:hypothetical protein
VCVVGLPGQEWNRFNDLDTEKRGEVRRAAH